MMRSLKKIKGKAESVHSHVEDEEVQIYMIEIVELVAVCMGIASEACDSLEETKSRLGW